MSSFRYSAHQAEFDKYSALKLLHVAGPRHSTRFVLVSSTLLRSAIVERLKSMPIFKTGLNVLMGDRKSYAYRIVPPKRKGLWGTIVSRERRCRRETSAVFTPSIKILPTLIGVKRKRLLRILDFPAPVLPAIPICNPKRRALSVGPLNN